MTRFELPLGTPVSSGSSYIPSAAMPRVVSAVLHVQMSDGTAWRYEVNQPYYATLTWNAGYTSFPVSVSSNDDLYPLGILKPPDGEAVFTFRGAIAGKPFLVITEDQALLP